MNGIGGHSVRKRQFHSFSAAFRPPRRYNLSLNAVIQFSSPSATMFTRVQSVSCRSLAANPRQGFCPNNNLKSLSIFRFLSFAFNFASYLAHKNVIDHSQRRKPNSEVLEERTSSASTDKSNPEEEYLPWAWWAKNLLSSLFLISQNSPTLPCIS